VPPSDGLAIMVGAGVAARMLLSDSVLDAEVSTYKVVSILDDQVELHGSSIAGVRVVGGLEQIDQELERNGAETVIVASSRRDSDLLHRVMKQIKRQRVRILRTPSYEDLVCGARIGELSECLDHLRGTEQFATAVTNSHLAEFRQKSVMVTGAGGSIGSEVVRQLAVSGCDQIVCLDRDESLLAATVSRASKLQHGGSLELLLMDIRDSEALNSALMNYRPDVVIHAAALKHVSILEKFPIEAWKTNVLGTANVIRAAQSAEVPVMINISTDKAASPSSALGFSKLITERLVVGSVNERPDVCQNWHSVRFGNVTRSRGSVFEIFEQQASSGGPLTVSHPEVRRFFISIERAAAFILGSVGMAHTAETLIPSMPVEMKILDIARRIAERFDPVPEIVYSGLKPGEKISEILVSDQDGSVRKASHEGVVAITQQPLSMDEITSSQIHPENVLGLLRQLCA